MAIRSHPIIGLRIGERLQAVEPPAPLIDSATLIRPSAAWAWGSDQLFDEYAADELRRDHDPATGAFRGVLVEESRTNELLDNRDLSTGSWAGGALSDQDQVGIDGQPNKAWTLEDTNESSPINKNQSITVQDGSNTHTAVWFIKKEDDESIFPCGALLLRGGSTEVDVFAILNKKTGNLWEDSSLSKGSYTFNIYDAGDYWRLVCTAKNNGTGNTNLIYVLYPSYTGTEDGDREGSATGLSVFDFGQIELNTNTPSSLIETDGTAVTRAADVLEGAFSESSGTLHFVGEHKSGDGVLWQADDGTEDKRIRLEVSGGDILFVVDDGGTNQVSLNAGALASDGTYNVAARFDGSDFAVSLDGAASVTSASGTVPSVTTQRFGRDTSATVGLNWYETANHRSDKLTNSGLEALTA